MLRVPTTDEICKRHTFQCRHFNTRPRLPEQQKYEASNRRTYFSPSVNTPPRGRRPAHCCHAVEAASKLYRRRFTDDIFAYAQMTNGEKKGYAQ